MMMMMSMTELYVHRLTTHAGQVTSDTRNTQMKRKRNRQEMTNPLLCFMETSPLAQHYSLVF